MAHLSTKTYGNERGLSCCSRQWAADSDCSLLHGYSFGFRFVFAAVAFLGSGVSLRLSRRGPCGVGDIRRCLVHQSV